MFFRKKPKFSLKQRGFLQATGVATYCLLVGLLLLSSDKLFGPTGPFLGPVMILVLLSVSVLVCGLLVFYLPYQMFLNKKRQEASELVLYTTGWLLAFLILVLLFSIIF